MYLDFIGIPLIESGAGTIFQNNVHAAVDSDEFDIENEEAFDFQVFPFGFRDLILKMEMDAFSRMGIQEGSDVNVEHVN